MGIPARASLAAAATIVGLLGTFASGASAAASASVHPSSRVSTYVSAPAVSAPAAAAPAAAAPAAAVPAADGCADGLGIAGRYGEFTSGDNRRGPGGRGAAGAVAVGGNAVFRGGGATVGRDLGTGEPGALPGGNALVVAGDVTGVVRVVHGNGVYGGTLTGRVEAPSGTVVNGPSPIDFAAEFAALRSVSAGLAAVGQSATAQWRASGPAGAVEPTGGRLRLTGTDLRYNSFVLPAAVLEKAAEIRIAVPVGATTVVTVEGAGYRRGAPEAVRFLLWDEEAGREVPEGPSDSAAGGAIRSKLLWNFPGAARVAKADAAAWPGSILAPDADVDLGAAGAVNGSVIAGSLAGAGGAETRHHPFTGCLPRVPVPAETGGAQPGQPGPAGTAPGPAPAASASGAAPVTSAAPDPDPEPTAAPDGSAPPPSASGAETGPRIEGRGGAPAGGLARTGGGVVAGDLAVGGAAVLATGTAMVLVARRRRT